MRISEEILDKCNTLEDLVEMMITTRDGKTKDFIDRYENFKETIAKELTELSSEQLLFIMDNHRRVVDEICSWYGFDRFLTALEFEQRKNK